MLQEQALASPNNSSTGGQGEADGPSVYVVAVSAVPQRAPLPHNVTPATIEYYETAFKALQRTHGPEPQLTRSALQALVVDLRQRGVQPISCNTYIKALNAFLRWAYGQQHLTERVELPVLKLEKRIIQTLTDEHIQALLTVKPLTFDQWRLHALIALALVSWRTVASHSGLWGDR